MDTLEIKLGSSLDIVSLERILKSQYSRSRQVESVSFNASSLSRSSLFSLGLVCLWAKRLRQKGQRVHFTFGDSPSSDRIQRLRVLLYRWRVIETLKNAGVYVDDVTADHEYSSFLQASQRAVIGLHFFQQLEDVSHFLNTVGAREPELFGDHARLELVGTGALRNIILQELLLNVFEHGRGISGFTAMSEHQAPQAFPEVSREIIAASPIWEQSFLGRLKVPSYLEVIVADHGPGIMTTLNSVWDSDSSRVDKHPTKELNVIEYSFGKYVSCKSDPDAYIREIINRAQKGQRTITGLYFVKSIAAHHGALLSVRSGASWLSWDFSENTNPPAMTHKADRRLRAIERFGGCQYRILFPLGRPTGYSSTSTSRPRGVEVASKGTQSRTLPFGKSLSLPAASLPSEIEGESLSVLSNSIRDSYRSARTNSWFVITLSGNLSSKRHALVILYIIADLQVSEKPVIVFAIGETATILRAAARDVSLEGDELPILCVDSSLDLFLVGDAQGEGYLFGQSISASEPPRSVLERLGHVAYWDKEEEFYRLRISSIDDLLLAALGQHFATWSVKPPQGIRHEGRFLLPSPSNAYCAYFWDVNEVVESKEKLAAVSLATALYFWKLKPSRVVALSVGAGLIAKAALTWLSEKRGFRSELKVLRDPQVSQVSIALEAISRNSVLVFTDVVGTGKVLSSVVDLMPSESIQSILAVIDAREGDVGVPVRSSYGDIKVASLIASPQMYYRDLPASWSYSTIQTIDRILHRPMSAQPIDLPPLLWGDDLEKILSHCADCGALVCGHFSSGTKHFSTFILTSRLIAQGIDDIVGVINQQIERASESLPPGNTIRISHAIYNEASSDAGRVCAMLADANAPCQPLGVPAKLIRSRSVSPVPLEEPISDVIIVEPAASSGETTRTLLTYAAQLQPNKIFLFIIVDRMPDMEAWLISNLNFVNGVRVGVHRFLALATSAYSIAECPQCMLRSEYELVAGHIGNDRIADYVVRRRSALSELPISGFRDPSVSAEASRSFLMWAEAAMQSRFHSAANDISARHRIAELISPKHETSLHCCGAILALARELPLFRAGSGPLRDVLYPTLRDKLIEACCAHLAASCEAEGEVKDAAIVVLGELLLLGSRRLPKLFWEDTSEQVVVALLGEFSRCAFKAVKSKDELDAVLEILGQASNYYLKPNGVSSRTSEAIVAVQRLLRSSESTAYTRNLYEKPASAWEVYSRLLKKHGHVAAGLDGLLAIISPARRSEEMQEYYERSWLDRVRRPVEESILPALVRLQHAGLAKIHGRRWPLDSSILSELSRRMKSVEERFRKFLTPREGLRSDEFQELIDELRSLRALIFGEDSAFLALLRRFVLRDVRDVAAHFRGAVEAMRASDISCSLHIEELPAYRGVFVSPTDLLTCLDALVHNVIHRAFPPEFAGEREASINSKIEGDSCYVLEVRDNGVGLREDALISMRPGGGLVDVQVFANAYGARVERLSVSPGFCVQIRWEMVDL